MMKILAPILLLATPVLFNGYCGHQSSTSSTADAASIETASAGDARRINPVNYLQPLQYQEETPAAMKTLLTQNNIAPLIIQNAPDDGFFGDDHYRIEFIITDMTPMPDNPLLYLVKGKNRHKKTVSSFEGRLEIESVAEFTDPNPIMRRAVFDMHEFRQAAMEKKYTWKKYSALGKFDFKEDSSKAYSGRLTGDFSIEFFTMVSDKSGNSTSSTPHLWYDSENSPSKGGGYCFNGNWASFESPGKKIPVIWVHDLYRFANRFVDEFFYGDRAISINEKYRALGWDTYWESEEWWNDSPKEKLAQ